MACNLKKIRATIVIKPYLPLKYLGINKVFILRYTYLQISQSI